MMRTLHILKSPPDETTRNLMAAASAGQESAIFALYDQDADYDELIDLVFACDTVLSWW